MFEGASSYTGPYPNTVQPGQICLVTGIWGGSKGDAEGIITGLYPSGIYEVCDTTTIECSRSRRGWCR
jgi:hypothetical protein